VLASVVRVGFVSSYIRTRSFSEAESSVVSDKCSRNRARRNNDVFVTSLHVDARYTCKLMETLETKSNLPYFTCFLATGKK
jgi:hypothetical protein